MVHDLNRRNYGVDASSVYLSPAPLYHSAPLTFCMMVQRVGGTAVVLDRFDPAEILAMIDRHRCVRAYFCGHNHAGGQVIEKGVPYITFKSILHEPGVTAYAVLRLFPDRLVIEGRGRELSRVIPLRVV